MSDISALAAELNHLLLGPLFRKYSEFPRELVHYTSLDALTAILSSGNLRMSHFRHLNDSTEMLLGRRIANGLMHTEVERHDDTSQFFEYCRLAFNEQDDDAIQYFLSSFSVLADSAELWRRYGDKGAGVAIAFDTRRMGADPFEPFVYHIGRVTYTPAEQTELLLPLLEATKTILRRYVIRYGYDVRDVAVQMLSAQLCSHLVHHSIALKNEGWSVEQEWRTVFSLLANDSDERRARVGVRSDGRPFVDIRVRSTEPDNIRMPIVRVTVGTHADEQVVRETLDKLGYPHVEIKPSTIATVELAK